MTNPEFSDQFDILFQNVTNNKAPGLNEYEKSIFLTKAQDEIVLSYFNPKKNKVQEGIDNSAERQIDFSMLITTNKLVSLSDSNIIPLYPLANTKQYALPTDMLVILNETLKVTRDTETKYLSVFPLTFSEYTSYMSKSYKRPPKNVAWRVSVTTTEVAKLNTDSTLNPGTSIAKELKAVIQLIAGSNDNIAEYTIRYVRRPRAIILSDLEGVTMDGNKKNSQKCELDPIIHQDILQRAVELAKASVEGSLSAIIQTGAYSATDKGYITQDQQSRR